MHVLAKDFFQIATLVKLKLFLMLLVNKRHCEKLKILKLKRSYEIMTRSGWIKIKPAKNGRESKLKIIKLILAN